MKFPKDIFRSSVHGAYRGKLESSHEGYGDQRGELGYIILSYILSLSYHISLLMVNDGYISNHISIFHPYTRLNARKREIAQGKVPELGKAKDMLNEFEAGQPCKICETRPIRPELDIFSTIFGKYLP